jgi:hypothetical protein
MSFAQGLRRLASLISVFMPPLHLLIEWLGGFSKDDLLFVRPVGGRQHCFSGFQLLDYERS